MQLYVAAYAWPPAFIDFIPAATHLSGSDLKAIVMSDVNAA